MTLSPLDVAVKSGYAEQVPMGLEFPGFVRDIVGGEWWAKNQLVIWAKGLVGKAVEDEGVELF